MHSPLLQSALRRLSSARRSSTTCGALLLFALVAPTLAPSVRAEDHSDEIVQTTRSYIKKNSPDVHKVTIRTDKVEGEYARVVVESKATGTAFAYLKHTKGNWAVLSLGTGFAPDFYKRSGIPKELRLSSSAPAPITPVGPETTITLARNPGTKSIGVEPLGGYFAPVIPSSTADSKGHGYTFSTFGTKQEVSILAIYATNSSRIPLEKPLARMRLYTLRAGETDRRIHVEMRRSPGSARELIVSAWDTTNKQPLRITQLSEQDSRQASLGAPTSSPLIPGLLAVAIGPNGPAAGGSHSGIKQFIGVRRAGGTFEPVLEPGASKGETYFCTSFPGQLTVDLRLFAGNNRYIENTKPYTRYLISGIKPNARPRNAIKLELNADSHGGITPTATEIKTGELLVVEKYSQAALGRLQEKGVLGQRQSLNESELRVESPPPRSVKQMPSR